MKYHYRCPDCDTRFIDEYPIAQNPSELTCLVCHGTAHRDFSAGMPQVQLVGWGWNTKETLDPMDPKNDWPHVSPPVPARPYTSRKVNKSKGGPVR